MVVLVVHNVAVYLLTKVLQSKLDFYLPIASNFPLIGFVEFSPHFVKSFQTKAFLHQVPTVLV